jgi:hypothetical protein
VEARVTDPTEAHHAIAARCPHPAPKWDDELEVLFCGACGSELDLLWPLRYLAAWSRARGRAEVRAALELPATAGAQLPDVSIAELRARMGLPPPGDLELDASGDLASAPPRRPA